jgi:diguanylate cyclase
MFVSETSVPSPARQPTRGPSVQTKELAAERRRLEQDLRAATKRQSFVLHYQPRVSLGTGRTVGAEALIGGLIAGAAWFRPRPSSPPPSGAG